MCLLIGPMPVSNQSLTDKIYWRYHIKIVLICIPYKFFILLRAGRLIVLSWVKYYLIEVLIMFYILILQL